jgi:hypothetical protein
MSLFEGAEEFQTEEAHFPDLILAQNSSDYWGSFTGDEP